MSLKLKGQWTSACKCFKCLNSMSTNFWIKDQRFLHQVLFMTKMLLLFLQSWSSGDSLLISVDRVRVERGWGLNERSWMKPRDSISPLYDRPGGDSGTIWGTLGQWGPQIKCIFNFDFLVRKNARDPWLNGQNRISLKLLTILMKIENCKSIHNLHYQVWFRDGSC